MRTIPEGGNRSMSHLLIVADDITGSLDTGVQASRENMRCVVGLWPQVHVPPTLPASVERHVRHRAATTRVTVVDTESRHVEPEEAAERVSRVVGATQGTVTDFYYKKTDSTLRGNIGAELAALLQASGRGRLAYAPAFPGAGRSTVAGRQLVHGKELEATSFARDPLDPVETGDIRALIGGQTPLPVTLCSAPDELPHAGRIVVFDATTDNELLALARRLAPHADRWAFGGSAGFAAALLRAVGESSGEQMRSPDKEAPDAVVESRLEAPNVLIVNGSLNPVSIRQTMAAKACGVPSVDVPPRGTRVLETAYGLVSDRGVVILESREPATTGSADVAERLGRVAAALRERIPIGLVVVFGGDTLMATMRAMNITGMVPIEEILPGVPISLGFNSARGASNSAALADATGQNPVVVSKAGGFGEEDIVAQILAHGSIQRSGILDALR